MQVLSVQSSVAYGYVGNAVAVPVLQRLGHEVWPVHTVHLSNHRAYPTSRGPQLTADDLAAVFLGLEERGVLGSVDAVLTGYLGTAGAAGTVLDAVRRTRELDPGVLVCCDPVLGDAGRGLFVPPAVAGVLTRRGPGLADLMTPNAFELAHLSGRPVTDVPSAVAAADTLRAAGPDRVLVTSVGDPGAPTLDVVLVGPDGAWTVTTARLPVAVGGTGDLTAAVLLGRLLHGEPGPQALAATVATVQAVLELTAAAGAGELRLVEGLDLVARPPAPAAVRRVR